MALKGSVSKEIAIKKILETFPNSFQYEKEISFPCNDGAVIHPGIPCRLHCRREEYE